jgi:ribosomal-protein-alanine N-acetyltransferase
VTVADLQLTTRRLHLAPITDDDVASLVRHWGDEQVRRYLWNEQPVTLDMVNAVVTTSNQDFRTLGFGLWSIRAKSDLETLVGVCGLRKVQGTGWVEILFSLRPRYWGLGYATEAAQAVLRYGLMAVGLERIVASSDLDNLPSGGVLRRVGMSFYADLDAPGGRRHYWSTTREQFSTSSEPPSSSPPPGRAGLTSSA